MANLDNKLLKKKKLDKDVTLLVTQNRMSGRIFVEFSSETSKLKLQKSFQNTVDGDKERLPFQESIKSITDLRRYFGLPDLPKVVAEEVVRLDLTGDKNVTSKSIRRDQKS